MNQIFTKFKINKKDLLPYPLDVYKIRPNTDFKKKQNSKLILITATNPTPTGEGKTTVSIEIADALNAINKKTILCLRQPAIGPTLGFKGGGTGFKDFSIIPSDWINLGFTGDFYCVETINNLISSLIDNQLYFDNELHINPEKIVWRRTYDISDRGVRNITINLKLNISYDTGFDITSASEIMAILCLSKDLDDFINKINNIIVAYNKKNEPIFVRDFKIENTVRKIARFLLWPNLTTTKHNSPCLLHGGPFANIAHGCNSILALNTASKYADYVITEAGFGADLGAEKFINIVGRSYRQPDYVFICTSIKSIMYHGNSLFEKPRDIFLSGTNSIVQNILGLKNMHIKPCIILNVFPDDKKELIKVFEYWANRHHYAYIMLNPSKDRKQDLPKIGKQLLNFLKSPNKPHPLYKLTDSFTEKMNAINEKVYGFITPIRYSEKALKKINKINYLPYYVCIAKTPRTISSDATQLFYSDSQGIVVTDILVNTGAQFIIPLCGDIYRMPGLPKKPNAQE